MRVAQQDSEPGTTQHLIRMLRSGPVSRQVTEPPPEPNTVSPELLSALSEHQQLLRDAQASTEGLPLEAVDDSDAAREARLDGLLNDVAVATRSSGGEDDDPLRERAGRFVAAARTAGGQMIASARIPAQDVLDALDRLEATT